MCEPIAASLTAVSAFAGVGGFDLALERAGVHVAASVEIDDAARGVLTDRFPNVPTFTDIREVKSADLRSAGFEPERGILTGGWPCQDHSIAGRRAGLSGARSGLFTELARLAEELRPRWLLFENVFGLLSSGGGADMGRVLKTLVKLGYGVSWRVLDARYFGVPQRRRRVLFVGHLGGWSGPQEVLLESPRCDGDSPASQAPGPSAPRSSAASPGGGSRAYGVSARDANVSGPLGSSRGGHRVDLDSAGAYVTGVLGDTAHTLTAEGHDASEDGTGRGTPVVAYPVAFRGREGGLQAEIGGDGEPSYALRSASGGASSPMVLAGTLLSRYAKGPSTAAGDPLAVEDLAVRRLTPRECERLQGFPDDWTLTSRGKAQYDSARYRQLGNAVPVPVAEWAARRLVAVDGRCRCGQRQRDPTT